MRRTGVTAALTAGHGPRATLSAPVALLDHLGRAYAQLVDLELADTQPADRALPDARAAHQVPLPAVRTDAGQLAALEEWMRSYRPDELFDADGVPRKAATGWLPRGDKRMGAAPHANGGILTRALDLPDFRSYAVKVGTPGAETAEATRVLGGFVRDVMTANAGYRNFRLFGPDETESNRLGAVFEVTGKAWQADLLPTDNHLALDGRVMEILSEHTC